MASDVSPVIWLNDPVTIENAVGSQLFGDGRRWSGPQARRRWSRTSPPVDRTAKPSCIGSVQCRFVGFHGGTTISHWFEQVFGTSFYAGGSFSTQRGEAQ
jgi:hypothetical protein